MKAPKKSTSKKTSTKPSASPATSSTPSPSSPPSNSKNVFRIHGVNVLNRKNVDSIARLTALERRRATHILDERQRRDTMNQLLTELSNLVRESAADLISLDGSSSVISDSTMAENDIDVNAAATTTKFSDVMVSPSTEEQPPSSSPPPPEQPSLATTSTTITAMTQTLNADGTERRPPVKSNSITTLRSAIAEIHRLRTIAGLQHIIAAQSSTSSSSNESSSVSVSVSSPPSVTSSPSRSSSPPLHSDALCSLSTLAALACQSEGQSPSHTMAVPSPSPHQQQQKRGDSTIGTRSKSKRYADYVIEEKEEELGEDEEMDKTSDFSMRMGTDSSSLSRSMNQLYSPPLSPSSPTSSQSRQFSSLPMLSAPAAVFAHPPPLHPHYHDHYSQNQYQHQYQQHHHHHHQVGLTLPTLPSLYSLVSPIESESKTTDYQSHHF